MESLVTDFVRFSSAFAIFWTFEGRLGARLQLHSILKLS